MFRMMVVTRPIYMLGSYLARAKSRLMSNRRAGQWQSCTRGLDISGRSSKDGHDSRGTPCKLGIAANIKDGSATIGSSGGRGDL